MLRFLLMFAAFFLHTGTLYAQTVLNPDRDKPLEVTADETLEWHRPDLKFIARGNAVATQGETTIRADVLTADYRETRTSSFEIYRLTAEGNVIITAPGNTARGGKATYDVEKGVAVMTGGDLIMTAPDQTVTAQDSFEYYMAEGRLTATGEAVVKRGADSLRADRLSAFFVKDAAGQNQLARATADGNIVIRTPTETLYGDRGEYRADNQTAEVSGNVRIERGPNILQGDQAEVNLATHVSKIKGSESQGGRVRGVFYPGSEPSSKGTPEIIGQ